MPQNPFYRFLILPLLVLIIAYFMLNPITLFLSYFWGDYPGPATLANQTAHQTEKIDWLLIHGASADARVWKPFLNTHCGESIVAISLGDQEFDPSQAKPGITAGQQLADFLTHTPIHKGIITHSTGSLWLAQAYHECPECFKNLKIILLAPSTGNNAIGLTRQLRRLLLWGSILAPNPYVSLLYSFGIDKTSACIGGNINDYPTCLNIYLYGRKFIYTSYSYYRQLTDYMLNPSIQEDFKEFLKDDAKNISIYLPGDDHLLTYVNVKKLADENNIPVKTIADISHEMILTRFSIWFSDENNFICPSEKK